MSLEQLKRLPERHTQLTDSSLIGRAAGLAVAARAFLPPLVPYMA